MTDTETGYFSVESPFEALLDPICSTQLWLSEPDLTATMPSAFALMAQVSELERHCLPLLRGLEQHAQALAEYLSLQSQKIDLVLQQQLAQDPSAHYRGQGLRFGGSKITVTMPQPIALNQALAIRLFLPSIALFAHGDVVDCVHTDTGFEISIRFCSIREQDQDRIVRASLQIQQKLLRQRARQQRDQ